MELLGLTETLTARRSQRRRTQLLSPSAGSASATCVLVTTSIIVLPAQDINLLGSGGWAYLALELLIGVRCQLKGMPSIRIRLVPEEFLEHVPTSSLPTRRCRRRAEMRCPWRWLDCPWAHRRTSRRTVADIEVLREKPAFLSSSCRSFS